MDDHGQLEYATAGGNDYPSHEQMYRTFVTLTKRPLRSLFERRAKGEGLEERAED